MSWSSTRSTTVRDQHKRLHPPTHCANCGNTGHLIQDHIIPLAAGGPDTVNNLQWLCRKCDAPKTEAERRTAHQRKQRYRNTRKHLPIRPHPGD